MSNWWEAYPVVSADALSKPEADQAVAVADKPDQVESPQKGNWWEAYPVVRADVGPKALLSGIEDNKKQQEEQARLHEAQQSIETYGEIPTVASQVVLDTTAVANRVLGFNDRANQNVRDAATLDQAMRERDAAQYRSEEDPAALEAKLQDSVRQEQEIRNNKQYDDTQKSELISKLVGERQLLEDQRMSMLEQAGQYMPFLKQGTRGAARSLGTAVLGSKGAGAFLGAGNAAYGAIGLASAQEANRAITEGTDAGLEGSALAGYVASQGIIEAFPATLMQKLGLGGVESLVAGPAIRGGVKAGFIAAVKATGQEIPEELETELLSAVSAEYAGVDKEALDPDRLSSLVADTVLQTVLMGAGAGAVRTVQGAAQEREAALAAKQFESPEIRARNAMSALEKPPGAHKWAEIYLGDRKRFKEAPDEATRTKQWEESRGTATETIQPLPTGASGATSVPPPIPTQATPPALPPTPPVTVPPPLPQRKGPTDASQVPANDVQGDARTGSQVTGGSEVRGQGQVEGGTQPASQEPSAPQVQVGDSFEAYVNEWNRDLAKRLNKPEGPVTDAARKSLETAVENTADEGIKKGRVTKFASDNATLDELQLREVQNAVRRKGYDATDIKRSSENGVDYLEFSVSQPAKPSGATAATAPTQTLPKPSTPEAPKEQDAGTPSVPPEQAGWDVVEGQDGKLYRQNPNAKTNVDRIKTRQAVDPSEGAVLITQDKFGKPIPEETLKARQEFADKAKPGVEFEWKNYQGQSFKVLDDGTLLNSSGRKMGTVQSNVNTIKPSDITWKETPSAGLSEESGTKPTTVSSTASPDASATPKTSMGETGVAQSSEARADDISPEVMSEGEFAQAAQRGVIGPAEKPGFTRIDRPQVKVRSQVSRDMRNQVNDPLFDIDRGRNLGYSNDDIASFLVHSYMLHNNPSYRKSADTGAPQDELRKMWSQDAIKAAYSDLNEAIEQNKASIVPDGILDESSESSAAEIARRMESADIDRAVGDFKNLWGMEATATPADKLSDEQKEALDFATSRGQKMAFVDIAKSDKKAPIGSYHRDDKVILISNTLQGDKLWGMIGHEMAHSKGLDEILPADSAELQQMMDEYYASANDDVRKRLKTNKRDHQREGRARMVQKFFEDKAFRDRLKQNNPTMWEKLREAVLKFVGQWTPKDEAKRLLLEELRTAPKPQKSTGKKPSGLDKPESGLTKPEPPASRTVERTRERVAAAEAEGITPYVTVLRSLSGGRRQYEGYNPTTGDRIAIGNAIAGPGSVPYKLSNRKGRYQPVDTALYPIGESDTFTPQWYESEAARYDKETDERIAKADQDEADATKPSADQVNVDSGAESEVKPESPAVDEFTAAINDAFDKRFGNATEEAEPAKPPKKRSVRKDQTQPEKKTLTDKAKERKERTSAVKAEKLAKFKELLKQKKITSGVDPELLAATVELTAAAIDDGVSTFAEYVAWIADNIGQSATRTIAPYLEAGWNRLGTYDQFRGKIDRAGKVEDFLTEVSDEIDTGSTRDGGDTATTRSEDLETGKTETGGITDSAPASETGDGSSGELAGDGGRTEDEGAEPSGSTERGDEDVRLDSGPGGNYRIGADERVGSGAGRGFSPKSRFAENVKAIRLLKKLEKEGRKATAEEQSVLVKYVGWGGLKQAFGRGKLVNGKTVYQPIKGYESEFAELKDLLTEDEWSSAKKSITNAHYTDPAVIRGMWEGLKALGFKGGKIVEPSAGTGLFFGLIPQSILNNPSTRLAATEIDSVSGRIAQQLYQGADIRVHGFEELNLADNSVDLFISNVPFGSNQLSDKKDRSIKKDAIHNFFFNKAIRKTRPGGLVAFITSRYSMDEKDASTRGFWDKNGADLVGVVRLPGGAFKGIANTDVVTDIIILQKREEGADPSHAAPWKKRKNVPQTGYLELVPRTDGQKGKLKVRNEGATTFPVNEYFEAHPEHVVGELAWTGTMQKTSENQVNVEPPTGPIGDRVNEIIGGLPVDKERLDRVAAMTDEMDNADMDAIKSGDWKEDHLRVDGDRVYINSDGNRVEVPMPYGRHKKGEDGEVVEIAPDKKGAARTTAIVKVFNAAERLIAMQPTNASDEQIEAARQELNTAYDAAVKEFGPLSSGRNATFARMSLTVASRIFSLEEYDPTNDTAQKAAIFRERTERPHSFPTTADNAQDALTISLSQKGRLDPEHVASFLGKPIDSTMEELGELVYKNHSGDWELAQTYLSGNVRLKLAEAKELAKDNDDYQRNVAALEAVQPKDLTPSQIEVRLNSPWIPTDIYEQFIAHLLRRDVKVSRSAAAGKWFLTPDSRARNDQLETLDWGIARKPALEIITAHLNRGDLRVWDKDGHGGRIVNQDDTTQVAAKLEKIKAEFERWLWADPARADRLTELYNREINNMHQEPRDGSHLTFPGMSEDVRAKLDKHQVNAVWRYLTGGNMLLAHVVGAGKSWIMTAAAMEQKRISGNPSFKTMIAVPNHLVTSGQFVKEILEAYPSAKVLAATPDSLSGIGRRSFLKKMATGNYDIVVIAHFSFGKIPLNPAHETAFIQKQIDDLEAEVRTARADSDRSYEAELQTMLDNLRDKLADISASLNRDELSTYFDDLNIDSLFVDEAHEFKNLSFRTKMSRVPGVNQSGSNMAFDMWMKTTYFNQATNEKRLMFATGTPIANAIAEMYTMQRYLQPSELARLGLEHFDSWAASFADEVTKPEIDPAGGGMRMHSRLSQYINMPELSAIFRQIADVQTADMLVDVLKRPLIEGDAPQAIKAERNAILEEIIEGLQERAQRVRSGVVDKSEDNMLNIVTDGRKAATDIRLIDPAYPDLQGSKVNLAVENIHRIWEETSDKKSTQVVWLDVTSPNTDYSFNLYHEIVDKLAALGIPRDEIAIMHDYNEKTKAQLFRSMNKGDIRILLGSTAVMGTGVNVQRKLIASHHLDVPWRPDQLEQRDGRILRRGNTNKKVKIIRYISKGSFDAFMWDKIEQKASFIRAAMSGASDRVLDASEAEDMSAAEMKAAAADDPNLIRFVTVQAEVNKLESEYRGFLDQQSQIRRGIAEAHSNVTRYTQRLASFEELIAKQGSIAIAIPEGEVRAKVGNANFTDPKEFGEALTKALINSPKKANQRGSDVRFEYNGLSGVVSQDYDSKPDKFDTTGWLGSTDANVDLYLGDSPAGNITRLNNAIAKIKERPETLREEIERNRLKIPALEKRIQAEWPDAKKLSDLRQEQSTLAGLVQASGSDEHKQEIAKKIEQQTGRKVIISSETGRYLWKGVAVTEDSSKNAAQNEAPAVVPANIVDNAEGWLTAERNRHRQERLQKLRDKAEVYEWDRTINPRPPKKKPVRSLKKRQADSSALDAFTSPELQDRQSMGAAKMRIASAADLVGDDDGGSGSQYASPDEEFERRWQRATKGIGKKTLATKLREFWQELVKSTVRGSLPELPRTEQFGEARSAMHAYQNAPVYAQLATADLLKKTSKPLSASDYDLFTRIVIMRDQVEAAGRGERLSYGLTPGKAQSELDRLEALAESNERVQASLEYRRQWTEAMVDDFLSAHEYLGLDMSDRFKRENYFRHQVLYYMEAKQRGLGKKKVELTPNRSWLKGRTSGDDLGEAFDINANYLQAEWEVSTQMIADTKRAQAIGRLKRHYDKMRQLKAQAKQNNYVAVVGGQKNMNEIEDLRAKMEELRATGSLDSDEKAQLKAWSERLWELDPTMPFRQEMAVARDHIERGASALGEEVPDDFMRYVASLAKQDDSPLQPYAMQFLKAVSDRKAFIKNALGDKYETWEDVVPDDHEEVAIRPGRAMFQAYSVPEQIASELMADLSKTLGISADDLRPLTAMGSKYTPLVVPKEVAAQMSAIDNSMDFGWLDHMVTRPMNAWKRFVLLGPTRFIKYNLRNLSEVDKVLALNPKAIWDIPQAIRDLWKLYSGADDIPATVRDWVERGGSSTLVRVNELGELNELKEFARLIADKKSGVIGKVIKAPADVWRKYWSIVGIGSDFRESILRYAAYLNYMKQLEAGKLTNYGGSVRAEVDGIKDNKDKAMRLSADLLGDYGDISLAGQFLRSRVAPFWSFQETNVRTYFRGLINLASNEQSAIKAGMAVARAAGIGGLAKTPFLAYKLGRIAILFYGLKAMTTVFNQMLFGDDDDELPEDEKRKAHLTFGKNSKGEVQYFSRIGTAADVLDWVGLDSVDYDLRDVLDGRRTLREVLGDMAKSPVDKAYGMLSPFMKAPTELAVGQTAYPSVGKPRPIRDRGRYIAQNLGIQKEYDKLMGNPSTPYSVTDMILYKVEPGTSAYYMTQDAKFRWLKTARNRGVGYSDSVRGNALRSYKMAVRLNDQVAADKYLAEYEAAGGKKEGLLDSLEWNHPAGGLSTIDAYLFYKSLSPVEQDEYRKAEQFYYSELLTEDQAKEIRKRREKRLKDLAVGKNKDGSPKGKPEKQQDETNAEYRERKRTWEEERKTAREALQEFN